MIIWVLLTAPKRIALTGDAIGMNRATPEAGG
jgi:hypothetical protein